MGILTSQRSNEVSYCHVHHVGLVGLDSAALHADNSYVGCMNMSLPLKDRPNCSKDWHHNVSTACLKPSSLKVCTVVISQHLPIANSYR